MLPLLLLACSTPAPPPPAPASELVSQRIAVAPLPVEPDVRPTTRLRDDKGEPWVGSVATEGCAHRLYLREPSGWTYRGTVDGHPTARALRRDDGPDRLAVAAECEGRLVELMIDADHIREGLPDAFVGLGWRDGGEVGLVGRQRPDESEQHLVFQARDGGWTAVEGACEAVSFEEDRVRVGGVSLPRLWPEELPETGLPALVILRSSEACRDEDCIASAFVPCGAERVRPAGVLADVREVRLDDETLEVLPLDGDPLPLRYDGYRWFVPPPPEPPTED